MKLLNSENLVELENLSEEDIDLVRDTMKVSFNFTLMFTMTQMVEIKHKRNINLTLTSTQI